MAHTPYTLGLSDLWDLTLDNSGNLVVLTEAAATAQNVANECRLFTKDAYFAQTRGIPYQTFALGHRFPDSLYQTYLREAALRVDGVEEVTDVRIDDIDLENRTLSGEIQFTMEGDRNVAIDL